MKVMPDTLRQRIFDIRCRSKRGQKITDEELLACADANLRYASDYSRMTAEVFEETKPFGSH